MISAQEALEILDEAELICPAEEVAAIVKRMAGEISARPWGMPIRWC